MSIWFQAVDPSSITRRNAGCANEHVGIDIFEAGEDYLKARMPVDSRTRQPAGILHGGMSVVLAETLASWAATLVVDPARFYCVGQEINANHVRAVADGWVEGIARPLHLGRTSHVWDVRISDAHARLVCVSRVTIAVLSVPSKYK